MGKIFALAGPSGVGKTTFLNKLFEKKQKKLKLLVRATSRPKRPNEQEGIDYNFYSSKGFLHKVSSNDFIHIESYGDYLFGIEENVIENILYNSKSDGIIMAGIYGALHLKDIYKESITILYMYPGKRNTILNPDCLEGESKEIKELIRRLELKYKEGDIEPEHNNLKEYIKKRMNYNYVELAFTIGKLRSKHNIKLIENPKDNIEIALNQFIQIRSKSYNVPVIKKTQENQSFVLMPFRDDLKPVYEDHIKPTMESLGYSCFRADGIFSNKQILDDIIDAVQKAYIIISDLTDGNPNVFYETGYCHAIGKKVILITQDDEVPFDLKSIRHIKYSYTPRGMKDFEEKLKKTVEIIVND